MSVGYLGIAPTCTEDVCDTPCSHFVHQGATGIQKASATGCACNQRSEEQWPQLIEWVGEVKERKVPGAEISNWLYAGKKRMFKGHKWERVAEKKALKRRMLMRDMAKCIQHYKRTSIFSVSFLCPCVASLQFLPHSITRGGDRTRLSPPRPRAGSFHSRNHVFMITFGFPVFSLVAMQIPIINSASWVNSLPRLLSLTK